MKTILTNEEKAKQRLRVAVAKDVILSLPGLKVESQNVFCAVDTLPKGAMVVDDSKRTARNLQKGKICEVCARGALFLSKIALRNNFDFDLMTGTDHPTYALYAQMYFIQDVLDDTFSREQQYLIETAFEGHSAFRELRDDTPTQDDLIHRALKFHNRYKKDKTRLRAIMQNVIDNKGEFKP
jgi:hypothetical protein